MSGCSLVEDKKKWRLHIAYAYLWFDRVKGQIPVLKHTIQMIGGPKQISKEVKESHILIARQLPMDVGSPAAASSSSNSMRGW